MAGYLPQWWDQTKARAAGGIVGGFATLGNLGGVKAGITAGSGLYSYNQMKGAAFKGLIDAGVPQEIALKAANDEALLSSFFEMADTGIDLVTLGTGKLLNLIFKGGAKNLAKNAAQKTALKKVLGILKGYGLNIASEGAQEFLQEGVSIANRSRAQEGKTGFWNLAGSTANTIGTAVTGQDRQALEQMLEAGGEGAKPWSAERRLLSTRRRAL